MRRVFVAVSIVFFSAVCAAAQTAVPARQKPADTAVPAAVKDLPVRKVVLYKNGVGYFEHAGTVTGNQKVSVDFTSSQLNDVLQSLTVLDEGGGRIAGVNYNSTTPLAEQLKSLSLGMDDDPNATELFQALRGQRVEVTGAPGGPISGRLMSIETRTEHIGPESSNTDSASAVTVDRYYLTLVAATGAVRVIELTPQLSVRPLDAGLQAQLDRYLELLSTTHADGLRHLTLNALGQGQRELRVSYISEVPVWKSTYRMVFPRDDTGKAILQGWAVVDNTVGSDWDNVQLSLVAGAPQSFIQPLSQPLYVHRPEVPIATEAQLTPQTHEAAETVTVQSEMLNSQLTQPKVMAAPPKKLSMTHGSFGIAGMEGTGGVIGGGWNMGGGLAKAGSNGVIGGLFSATNAIAEGDVATKGFDDFFEYALTQPVTIHKNESAMVPILQQDLPAEHVTLWSQREAVPLRAVWLNNTSKLTLDSGSFSIFENGEFAGEGLLDAIHPGEKRLLSYAADQAVRVRITDRQNERKLSHLEIHSGVLIETHMDVAAVTYTATNSGDEARAVLIEHPRRTNGWSLDEGLKADETAANLYRFKVPVAAHSTAKLDVREHGPEQVRVNLNSGQNLTAYLLDLVKQVPGALDALKPVIDAQETVAKLDFSIAQSKKNEETAAADEARVRDNLTALKGNEAAKRFVDELNRAEDTLQAARKQTTDLEQQKQAAVDTLHAAIAAISFDWDVQSAK